MTVRVVLADDHDLVRHGLTLLLEVEGGFEVAGEAGDGLQAVETCARLRPEILIVDMVLPKINGIEVTREVGRYSPETRAILLSMYDHPGYVTNALQAGAWGYVLKRSKPNELLVAIRQVLAGEKYLSPELDAGELDKYAHLLGEPDAEDRYALLTERERQVFLLAARGASSRQIAGELSLSVRTVETHRANLLRKLNVKSQSELVLYAVKRGLID